jgi:hypothetical protein
MMMKDEGCEKAVRDYWWRIGSKHPRDRCS